MQALASIGFGIVKTSSGIRAIPALLFLLVLALGTFGCATLPSVGQVVGAESEPSQALPADSAFVEAVAGTGVSLRMVPVQLELDAGDGTLWFSETEVTWDLYDIYVFSLERTSAKAAGVDAITRPSKPYVLPGDAFGHRGLPAMGATLHAAKNFAEWLSVTTGRGYRLPTDAEWEAACQAGTTGDSASTVWSSDTSDDRVHKAGEGEPDGVGLLHMRGNVAEWVTPDPGDGRVADGAERVVRGGSFDTAADAVSCQTRAAQKKSWNATDPQLPKSTWWLSDAPFVGIRLVTDTPK